MDSHRTGRYFAEMIKLVGGDEKEGREGKMEGMQQLKVAQMIKSAEGSAGLLHKIITHNMDERNADLGK